MSLADLFDNSIKIGKIFTLYRIYCVYLCSGKYHLKFPCRLRTKCLFLPSNGLGTTKRVNCQIRDVSTMQHASFWPLRLLFLQSNLYTTTVRGSTPGLCVSYRATTPSNEGGDVCWWRLAPPPHPHTACRMWTSACVPLYRLFIDQSNQGSFQVAAAVSSLLSLMPCDVMGRQVTSCQLRARWRVETGKDIHATFCIK